MSKAISFLLLCLTGSPTALSFNSYLSSLSEGATKTPLPPRVEPTAHQTSNPTPITFHHAPQSYFALSELTPKGPRENADVGNPHDASRKFISIPFTTSGTNSHNEISSGSWWCAAGGWPSPRQRATTEIFYVFSGHGCLTDLDGWKHYFGPGDTVILPKGWSGRWDVLEDVHKVWFVHDHPEIEDKENVIRARITHYNSFVPPSLSTVDGSLPMYKVGPTEVACVTVSPGSFLVDCTDRTQCFHLFEGVAFLVNPNGSAQRCVAGDTVVLPKGWQGQCDVLQNLKKLTVVV